MELLDRGSARRGRIRNGRRWRHIGRARGLGIGVRRGRRGVRRERRSGSFPAPPFRTDASRRARGGDLPLYVRRRGSRRNAAEGAEGEREGRKYPSIERRTLTTTATFRESSLPPLPRRRARSADTTGRPENSVLGPSCSVRDDDGEGTRIRESAT